MEQTDAVVISSVQVNVLQKTQSLFFHLPLHPPTAIVLRGINTHRVDSANCHEKRLRGGKITYLPIPAWDKDWLWLLDQAVSSLYASVFHLKKKRIVMSFGEKIHRKHFALCSSA